MLRQDLLDLFDELKGNHSRLEKEKTKSKDYSLPDKTILDKTAIAEATLERFEKHFEYLTKVA